VAPSFVDLHSHVIPSGDDGARDLDEGLELCRLAASRGTRVLYGTPHAHPAGSPYPLTRERYAQARENHELMKGQCATFGLELRLGWEVAPEGMLFGEVADYALEGIGALLVELPGPWFSFSDPLEATRDQVAEIRAAGLEVILAHPERCPEIQRQPQLLVPFVVDGALVCFNGDSFIGRHDRASARCAWELLQMGVGDLIASDAHRPSRPSRMREAFDAVSARFGDERALALVDGSALSRLSTPRRSAPVSK
jgi:protein-tyrosine phosphatase